MVARGRNAGLKTHALKLTPGQVDHSVSE